MADLPNATKTRIIEVAESLFAEEGIAGTTLRQITTQADVNLAAVNYHFGNKQQLIHEVFQRRLDVLAEERIARLEELKSQSAASSLEDILQALIYPALAISRDETKGGLRFVKVMARAYAENDSFLHQFLSDHYGYVIRQFAAELKTLLPTTPDAELRWQLDFVIGALTYVMADFGNHFSSTMEMSAADIADRLVAFAAAGMRRTEDDKLNGIQPPQKKTYSVNSR